ncbi:MAG: TonB-dependent receptor plug domain-containing protein [Pontibacterium sp.]
MRLSKNALVVSFFCCSALSSHIYANDELDASADDFDLAPGVYTTDYDYINQVAIADLPLTEEYLFADIPEVTSATRLPQKLTDAPASMTIITREQIESSAVTEVFELLRLVPGMQVAQPTKNKAAVTYHGMSGPFPNRLEVMIDGRSIYLPLLSTVTWETLGIELDDIDYIEVVRGSNVPSQGSNAFLGAINIVTRSYDQQQGETLLGYGDQKDPRFSTRYGYDTEHGFANLSAGYHTSDPDSRYSEAILQKYINFSSSHSRDLLNEFSYGFGFSEGYSFVGDTDEEEDVFSQRDHSANYQYLTYEHSLGYNEDLKLSASHYFLNLEAEFEPIEEYFARDSNVSLAVAQAQAQALGLNGVMFPKSGEHGKSDIYQLEAQRTVQHNEAFVSVLGSGYKYERAKSTVLFDRDDWVNQHKGSVFGNLQWSPSARSTFNAGAMVEATDDILPRISPRLAYNYKPEPHYAFRTALSRAYRMPSLLERQGQISVRKNDDNGNVIFNQVAGHTGHLGAERIDTLELGFFGQLEPINGHLDVRVFYEDVDDGINTHFIEADPDYPDRDNYRYVQENSMFWHAMGFEFQVASQLSEASRILFNYNYTDLQGNYLRYNHPNNVENKVLDQYVPAHTASFLFSSQLTPSLQLGLNYYYMDDMKWFDGSDNAAIPAYQRLDGQLTKSLKLGTDYDANLRLVVQNLFDHLYSEYAEYNVFQRRIYLEFKVLY